MKKSRENKKLRILIEFILFLILTVDTLYTFFLSLINYGWKNSIIWLRVFSSNIGLDGIPAGILYLLSLPIYGIATFISFIIFILIFPGPRRILRLDYKYWYSLFVLQIIVWVLIFNIL